MRIGTPPDCYDQSNEGVNLDVASLEKGGGVEASAPRANSRSSQICTGSLRYYPGVVATQGNTTSDLCSMGANPIAPVPSPASLPDMCNHNYAIGPNSGYGVDMTAIGATTPAAGVAGIGVARTRSGRTMANADGNMDMHTENLNATLRLRLLCSQSLSLPISSLLSQTRFCCIRLRSLWWDIYANDHFFY
ncbi:hypothetical protein K435DRAFT_164696 [Dendrothele bispora CBS 962.96]|uniref:Uncharacterized protein n=1 Tax=Dendrothele bispora (strain CBS 962.96) TaxID=1314807 RepID=A0A4S8LXK7_DENBC|nr:hypothetical protein K435DRAFT_164696 [Dendrothele bispora CBS 962.96]